MRTVCVQRVSKLSAVHSPFALKTRCVFATSLRRFSQSGLKLLFFIFLCVDRASFLCDWDKPRSIETQRI